MADQAGNFGDRMTAIKRERGIPLGGPGRRTIAEKYKRQIASVEKTFADALPELAREYVSELHVHAPERCTVHGGVLRCAEPDCSVQSARTAFDHRAAGYALDRLLGKPTTRSEGTLRVEFVEQLTEAFSVVFLEVNALPDADARRVAFAERMSALAQGYA